MGHHGAKIEIDWKWPEFTSAKNDTCFWEVNVASKGKNSKSFFSAIEYFTFPTYNILSFEANFCRINQNYTFLAPYFDLDYDMVPQ